MIKLIITTFLFFSVQTTNAQLYGLVNSNGTSIIPEHGLIKVVFRSHNQTTVGSSLHTVPVSFQDNNQNQLHFSTGQLTIQNVTGGSELSVGGLGYFQFPYFKPYQTQHLGSGRINLLREDLVIDMVLWQGKKRTNFQLSYCQLFSQASSPVEADNLQLNTFFYNSTYDPSHFGCQVASSISQLDYLLGKITVRYHGRGLVGTGYNPDPPLFEVYLLGDVDTNIAAAHAQLKEFLKCLKSIKYGLENNLVYHPGFSLSSPDSLGNNFSRHPRLTCGGALRDID